MRRFRLLLCLLTVVCTALAVSACGKKGPLYLPDPQTKPEPAKPAR